VCVLCVCVVCVYCVVCVCVCVVCVCVRVRVFAPTNMYNVCGGGENIFISFHFSSFPHHTSNITFCANMQTPHSTARLSHTHTHCFISIHFISFPFHFPSPISFLHQSFDVLGSVCILQRIQSFFQLLMRWAGCCNHDSATFALK